MSANYPNPYIGPRTFRKEEGDRFFGRDREAADLEALVSSEKIVLFYAQSGAGKSSLINARLIPSLEDRLFEVLSARVSGDALPGAVVENIYIYNLVRSLVTRETDQQMFKGVTLAQVLKKLNQDENGYFYDPDLAQSLRSTFEPEPWPRILIIDQFEEILSTNVEYWQQRDEFFRQLAQAMQDDPFLWILLVMREDYIAALDPYVHLLPTGLRVRYYMERLSHEAAIKAIRSPVEERRPYAEGVAEKLAEDLSRVKVQKPDGTTGTEPGQYIEPVQLQVVCYSMWENLPPEGTEITDTDLQALGDVNQSLAKYYDQRVSEVAKAKQVKERQIRDWFDKKLITSGGIRSMVIQERETPPGGLDDDVIQALQSDLIRAEQRGGATWYELTHDRLVEPILTSNDKWFDLNLSPLQRQAIVWENEGRNDIWLLRDQAYVEVLPWVDEHQDDLTDPEMEFLEASREQHHQQLLEAKRRRRFTVMVTAFAAVVLMLFIVAVGFAFEARRQARISRVGELAAQSVSLRDENFLVSLLLGVEASKEMGDETNSVRTQSVLLGNSLENPRLEHFLNGNARPVVSAIFSPDPDSTILASGTYDNDILLWDVNTRQVIGKLSGHSNVIRSIAFNRDGSMMASGSQDNTVILWDMKTHQLMNTLSGHSKFVTSVAFSPDGKMLASGSEDMTIILWDVKTGQLIHTLKEHTNIVRSVTFSRDGKTLVSGGDDGKIIFWDVKTGEPVDTLTVEYTDLEFQLKLSVPVYSVVFSPDGKTLASGDYHNDVILWNVEDRQRIYTLSRHVDKVRALAFSPDGQTLASGSADRTIVLWDVETGQPLDQLRGHSVLINSLSFSPDGSTLASGSGDTTIILWSMNPRQPLSRPLSGYAHFGPVLSVAFSPDGNTLATGSVDTTIMLWNAGKGQSIGDEPLIGHTDAVRSVAFSPDGKTLASGSNDTTIILWDVAKRQPIKDPLSGHTEPVSSVAFSPDGKMLASGSEDTTIMLWDVMTHEELASLSGHTASVNSVAFHPDGKMLASGSFDGTIILWDVATHEAIVTLSGHTKSVTSIAFSPDGKTLASASADRTIILWDVKTHKAIVTLGGHLDAINSLAFSPDGTKLASGSVDKTMILWDMETHQPIGSFSGNSAPIETLAFSPDSSTLASGSFDVILWDASAELWMNASCQRAGRNFTRNEWKIYFPNDEYRQTCPDFPLEPEVTPTQTP